MELNLITSMQTIQSTPQVIFTFLKTHPVAIPFWLILAEEIAIPLPLPGEFLIIYSGYLFGRKEISFFKPFLAFFTAFTLGSILMYIVARTWGNAIVLKFGKYIHLDEEKLFYIERLFKKHGFLYIVIGRSIPGFRVPISIFSGMSKIPFLKFLLSICTSNILIIISYMLIGKYIGPEGHTFFNTQFWFLIPIITALSITCLYILIYRFAFNTKIKSRKNLKKT